MNGTARGQSIFCRRPMKETSCETKEPATTIGASKCGSSTQAQMLNPTSPKAKPESPEVKPAATAPRTVSKMTDSDIHHTK